MPRNLRLSIHSLSRHSLQDHNSAQNTNSQRGQAADLRSDRSATSRCSACRRRTRAGSSRSASSRSRSELETRACPGRAAGSRCDDCLCAAAGAIVGLCCVDEGTVHAVRWLRGGGGRMGGRVRGLGDGQFRSEGGGWLFSYRLVCQQQSMCS